MIKHTVLLTLTLFMLLVHKNGAEWIKEMEGSGNFDGDIILDPDELEAVKKSPNTYASIISGRWPNGVLPYMIDPELEKQYSAKINIQKAIADYEKYTCLKFVKRTDEREFLRFYLGDGCSASIGYKPLRTNHVSLGKGCHSKATILHEIGHAIGFDHEQNRIDRDSFVKLKWDNIIEDQKYNFKKRTSKTVDSLNTKYDYLSIMHYSRYAFARWKSLVTIDTGNSYRFKIGKATELSAIDKKQVNLMYKCSDQ